MMTSLAGFRPNPESRGDYTMRFWTLLPKLRLYNMTPVVQPGYLNSGFVNYRPTGLALSTSSDMIGPFDWDTGPKRPGRS